jgi:iron complex transport system substrate-binding protein
VRKLVWLAAAGLLLAACTGRGGAPRETPVPAEAVSGDLRRVVSLSPGVTEILFALGAGDLVAGVTQYCNYPPEAQTRTKVGGFSGAQVSVEQIAALKPDLVILSEDMHFRIRAMLNDLGITTLAVEPRSFEDVYGLIEQLGNICGRAEGAVEVVRGMREKVALAAERFAGREQPPVYWEISPEPLISVGRNTFISELIRLGGGRNIFDDLAQDYPEVSAEQVLLRRPEWIITGDDHELPADSAAFARRPGWTGIPALRDGRIIRVDADRYYRYGPRLADAALEIAGILHPEGGGL